MRRLLPLLAAVLLAPAGRAAAEQRWLEVKSEHFRVYTDGSEKDARKVATGFEQLRRLFQGLGDFRVDPPAPIAIVAARNQDTLRSFVPGYGERRGGSFPAGVFMSGEDKHYILLDLDVPSEYRDDVVYHEYVHLVANLNFSGLPLWLNEGLAEFYAATVVLDDKVRYGRVNPNRLRVFEYEQPLPLPRLFAIDAGSREYNEASRVSVLYAQSALLTHYFLIGEKGVHRSSLIQYLQLRSSGALPEEAEKKAFGDLGKLQKDFYAYLHSRAFLAIEMPLDVSAAQATVRTIPEAEALAVRADVLARSGRAADARPLLARARSLDPGLPLAAEVQGRLESAAGHPEEARKALSEAARLAPDQFSPHFLLAEEMLRTGTSEADLAAAEAAVRRAAALNPSFAPAHALLSDLLVRRGQPKAAFLALDKANTLEPSDSSYWARRADLLRVLKRPDVADTIEAQLAQRVPADPQELAALTAYYASGNRPQDTEKLLRKAGELNPRSTYPWTMLSQHLAGQQRMDDAEAALRRALAAQPDNASVMNELAYFNAERGAKLPEALQLVDRALKTFPDSGNVLDTKGWVLFRMGRLEEAEKVLRRALEKGDNDVVAAHLREVQEKRGQPPSPSP